MTKQGENADDRATERPPARPVAMWELADESYSAWLQAERQLRHQRHLLPLERR